MKTFLGRLSHVFRRSSRGEATFVDAAERVAEREDEAGLAADVARRGVE